MLKREGTLRLSLYTQNKLCSSGFDIEILIKGKKNLAEVVKIHGDLYLPAFIRIHNEIEHRKKEVSYKEMALQLAANDS